MGIRCIVFKFRKQFSEVKAIDNWNISYGSTQGDFDNDGKKDLVTREGCAYLTKVNINNMPVTSQCTDIYTTDMYKGQFPQVGQSFNFSSNYTYVARQNDGSWIIEAAFPFTRVEISKIGSDGTLTHFSNPPLAVIDNIYL